MAAPHARDTHQQTPTEGKGDRFRLMNALIVVLAGLVIWFIPPVGGLKAPAMHLTAIFIATILGLILQPLPQGAVVIIGIALVAITDTLSIADSMAGVMDATAG